MMVLAFLPAAERIEPAFRELAKEPKWDSGNVPSYKLRSRIRRLVSYYERQWLERVWSERISVFAA